MLSARILEAARAEFAEHGWAGATIRAVARAADVDPALVYHYFGSKEGLLDAATTPPPKWLEAVAATWRTPVNELGRQLVRTMLDSWADDEIGPTLRAQGMIFVGIDVIGDYLTEINVTSPTGLQEIARFDGVHIEKTIWDRIEEKVTLSQ